MVTRIVAAQPRTHVPAPTPPRVRTPAPARPNMLRQDSRDSEIMREINRQLYGPGGRPVETRTWVDDFAEKVWPKIKAKWAAFKAKHSKAKPA